MGAALPFPTHDLNNGISDTNTLNVLLPMHVQLDGEGGITHVGPTFAKLFPENTDFIGQNLFQYIRVLYPRDIQEHSDLNTHFSQPLTAQLKVIDPIELKAVVVPVAGQTGVLINFAFGTSLKQAVSKWHLNSTDFSPADPSVEMLYVIEVQSALLEESKSLNRRLNGQWEEAEEKAYSDPLTGLSNRRALKRYMHRMRRRRNDTGFALFLIDLDHFKNVNDTLGHDAGDKVLQQVAEILLNETRPNDIVVRTGGDEFVLVIEDAHDMEVLSTIAARIISKVERPIFLDKKRCNVGASIGIIQSTTSINHSIDTILKQADDALYQSKRDGRGCYVFGRMSN
ncbi:GGDEF domain-containing protein [Amylibacter sp. SFDW26]|uniref:GGDEF domain-containing protein n=1 Tax=Amylibacter sp. SFDW26 TaxID=2652722 RepID=UPI0012629ABA|nr:GGDEF domain-containing protein [Amylibacter sp. SFDW26]KAB7615385.1 GGDEF domain-containing protein [Amylibacter sp. SFDW26]